MKKLFVFILTLVFVFPANVFAASNNDIGTVNKNVIYQYFDDGSYLVIENDYIFNLASDQVSSRAEGNYVVGSGRTAYYYDGNDNLDWKVTITGEFLIVPSNVNQSGYCQKAELTYKIYDSSWSISNIVEQEITNNACVSCTMKRKFLGVTTKTIDVSLVLTCDAYGNITP